MSDKMLRIAGRGEDGKAKALKTDNSGNVGMGLSSAKSIAFTTHPAIAIRDIVNNDSAILSVEQLKGYNNFFLEVSNGLDVDISVRIKRGGSWYSEILDVRAGRSAVFTPNHFPCFYLPGGNRDLTVRVTAKNVPTTGAVSTWLHATP